jgi:tetratricopeptide (TPR) repeat protein
MLDVLGFDLRTGLLRLMSAIKKMVGRVCKLFASFALFAAIAAHAADQHWLRVSSDHFVVITDAGEKPGHDVVAHFEQMRSIFGQLLSRGKLRMSEPMEIIAIRGDKDYASLAPQVGGKAIDSAGFWLSGEDRVFIVLNLSEPDPWRAVEHQFAHYMLNYNYPPTPPWFDEGFAEYFASLNLTAKSAELGSDPELKPSSQTDLLGHQADVKNLKSFTEILQNPVWLAWPDLLTMKNRAANGQEGTHHTLFYAQSWILVHYLLSKDKMSELGKYFGLVEIQRLPIEQGIQQAFGMSVAQLDQEVKAYFHSLAPLFTALDESQRPNAPPIPQAVNPIPLPFSIDDIGTSSKQLAIPEAQALVDEMELRVPERRQQAFDRLQKLIADPKTETVVAHRALAWAYVQKGDTKHAFEELNSAVQLNANDPWTRFGMALASYHSGEQGARVQGLANMMESLHIVIDEYPEFAEAYNMLGWARLAGGGGNAAVESMKQAIQLNPRDEEYQLRLARAYLAAKKFDEATATLEHLKLSQNPAIAQAAGKDLEDLPFLKKYGVTPQEATSAKSTSVTSANQKSADDEDEDSGSDQTPSSSSPVNVKTTVDKRPVTFLKATLLSVDCSKPPAAVLSVTRGGKVLKFRTPDYKSLAVIGPTDFSCSWKRMAVNLNYRAGGKMDGDLVSIEIPEAGR